MFRITRWGSCAAAAAPCFLLLLAAPSRSDAYELQTAPSGARVRWFEDQIFFEVDIDGHVAGLPRGAANDAALRALETWSSAGGPLLVGVVDDGEHQGGGDERDGDGDGSRGMIQFSIDPSDRDVNGDSLARTRLSFDPDTGQAQNVSITVNALDYRWAAGDDCRDEYDLEATLAHELGHALGLRHSSDPEATMFTRPKPCEHDRRDLAADDLAGIEALYGDLPSALEDAQSPPGGCAAGGASTPPGEAAVAGALLLLALLFRRRRWTATVQRQARPRGIGPSIAP